MTTEEQDEVIALSARILHSYFCECDVEYLISTFTPEIVWLGGGENQFAVGQANVAACFRAGRDQLFPCHIWDERYEVLPLGPDRYLCQGESMLEADPSAEVNLRERQRVSFIFHRTEAGLKLEHIHNSIAFSALQPDELYPMRAAKESYERLQEMLDQRNRQIDLMLPQLPGGMMVCCPDSGFTIKTMTPELCKRLGYPNEAAFFSRCGGSCRDFILHDDFEGVAQKIELGLAKEGAYTVEYRVLCGDGRLLWFMDIGKRFTDEDGEVVLFSFLTDITERKNQELDLRRANTEIRRQADFLTQLYNTVPCGIIQFTTDDTHRIIHANRRAWEIYGYFQPEYWTKIKDPFQFILPEQRDYFKIVVDKLSRLGGKASYERIGLRQDNSHCWVSVDMERVENADGDEVIQAVFNDITEAKQFQEEREQEQRLENRILRAAIFTAYPFIMRLNLTNDTFDSITAGKYIVQYPSHGCYSVLFQQVYPLIHPSFQAEYEAMYSREALIEQLNNGNTDLYLEFQHLGDDGSYHWVSAHIIHVDNPYGKDDLAIILFRVLDDLRAEKARQEQLLRDALATAEAANNAKSDFLSRMSHDIRTPINAIVGMSAIGQMKMDDRDKVLDCFHKIDASSRYLLSLINDILDMSKIERGKMVLSNEKFDFTDFINNLTCMIYPQAAERNLSFEVRCTEPLHRFYQGDALRLNQILMNLLSNALKFTPSGGSISLEMRELKKSSEIVILEFIVTDTGIGMSPDFLEHIYQPFEQEAVDIARNQVGSGLGLSIVYNLVKLMGGEINVSSIQGEGTTFTLAIPLLLCADDSIAEREERSRRLLQDLKVLIVDDDDFVGEQASAILSRIGVSTFWVNSGQRAIIEVKKAVDAGNPYDLALIDWRMPEMNGLDTTRNIRQLAGQETMIIIISAYDWSSIESEARSAGADYFISKPLFQSTVYDVLSQLRLTHQKPAQQTVYRIAGQRVLLVEDNELNLEIAKSLLEMQGIIVDTAVNGALAVELFASVPEDYYLAVLMDIRMPAMNGLEATRAIRLLPRKDAASLPIIAMSANAFNEDIKQALEVGMNGYLVKPVYADLLYQTIQNIVNNHT